MPIGPSVGVIRVKKPKIDIKKTTIKKIIVSPCNVFYLVDDGSLYGWGSNNKLQFGSGISQVSFTSDEPIYNPADGKILKINKITDTGYVVNYPLTLREYRASRQGITSTELKDVTSLRNMGYNGYNNRAEDYYFSGNPKDLYTSFNFLKTVRVKVFNNFTLKDIDIVQLNDVYGSSVLGIDNDGFLYVWGQSDNLVFGIFTETNNYTFKDSTGYTPGKGYYINLNVMQTSSTVQQHIFSTSLQNFKLQNIIDKPKKISDEKWESVVANNVILKFKHILLRSDGTIHTLGGDNNGIIQLGSNSDWKYIAYDYAINNNNELYRLSNSFTYEEVTPNQFMGIGTKLGNGNSTTVNRLTLLNFSEKIKNVYGALSSDDVLFLSETGKVSGVGGNSLGVMGNASMNQYNLYDIPRNNYTAIKDIVITNYNSVFAQTTDNSLLAWGDNRSGQLGYGNLTTPYKTPVNKITAVNGLVQSIHPSFNTNFYTLVLGINSKLSSVGQNTNGVLGSGNSTNRTTFAEVQGISGIKQVINNSICNYTLGNNGLLSGWGKNGGLLGSFSTTTIGNITSPYVITGSRSSRITVDSNGNLYISDWSKSVIRKIDTSGNSSIYAGIESSTGTTNGASNIAKFNQPHGMVTDSSNNLYICDMNNHTIRKIDTSGNVTTFAGVANSKALTNGPRSTAKFNMPMGITIDTSGNFYIADKDNNVIRKIDTTGNVTTFATGINKPTDITIDTFGNLYVTTEQHTIFKINNIGTVTTFAGSSTLGSTDGIGSAAAFSQPRGITIDSFNNLYVCDYANHTIRKITPAGVVTTYAGKAGTSGTLDGTGTNARFFNPSGIIMTSSNVLYIVQYYYGTNATTTAATIRKLEDGPIVYNYNDEYNPILIPFVNNINRIFASKYNNTVYTLGINKEVSAWGSNDFGQLGINTTQTSVPTATKLPLSNIQDIIIKYNPKSTNTDPTVFERPTVYFLDESGGLSGCGFNGNGNLGFISTGVAVSAVTKINIPPVRMLYSDAQGFVYAVGTNNELSGWGKTETYTFIPKIVNTNNIAPIYRFSQLSDVNYLVVNDSNIDFGTGRMACVVGLNQKLTAWGGTGMIFNNTNPAEVSNVKSVSSIFINYRANNVFINGAYYQIKSDRDYTTQQKIGANDWKIVDKHGDFAIKLDNTLWSISSTPFQIGTDNNYENVYYETPVKSTEAFDIRILVLSSQNVDKTNYEITKSRSTGAIFLNTRQLPSPNPFSTEPSKQCFTTTKWEEPTGTIFDNDKTNITVKF